MIYQLCLSDSYKHASQDPKKRATAQEILQHDWMRENGTASDKPLDNVILNRMRGFAGMNKLKKEALKVIATGMSPEEIAGLRALFQVRSPTAYSRALGLRFLVLVKPSLYDSRF